jgi:diguanylate cyclase (GGDEF)-like protein/PAS domain S-box-containing protein
MKSIATKFLLPVVALSFLLLVLGTYREYAGRQQAMTDLVDRQAALALSFDLAIRSYVGEEIRPAMEARSAPGEFVPETMSTSYVARNIFDRVRQDFPDCTIKFSSNDPRNPANRAGPAELEMIQYFNEHPHVEEWSGEIDLDGRPHMAHFRARRLTTDCLHCHGDPAEAPASLVERYGSKAGFHRPVGEVVALDTVAIPLDDARAATAASMRQQAVYLVGGFAVLVVSIALVFRLIVVRRLAAMRRHFEQIASQPDAAALRPAEVRGNDEISALATSFNTLVERIRDAHARLEDRVKEQTSSLRETNAELQREICERNSSEARLRESRATLEAIVRNAQNGIVLIDTESRSIVSANPAACRMFGAEEDAIVGHVCHRHICPRAHGECPILDGGEAIDASERVLLRADGEELPIIKSAVPVTIMGRPHLLETLVDISAQRQVEAALRERMKELSCLHKIEMRIRDAQSVEAICSTVAGVLPEGFCSPEHTCARIRFGGEEYCSDNFRESPLSLFVPIPSSRDAESGIEVFVEAEAVEAGQEAFLVEELSILETAATTIGKAVTSLISQHRLVQSERRFELAVRGSQDGIFDWDLVSDRIYYSPRWQTLLDCEEPLSDRPEEWLRRIASSHLALFDAEIQRIKDRASDALDMELPMQAGTGETRWMMCRGSAVRDQQGSPVRLAGAITDITALKDATRALEELTRLDPMTGLANRAVFAEQLATTRAALNRVPEQHFAVLFFDFDRFKLVNDSLGHAAGDALLVSIADRFREQVREPDCIARFGGDEFAVLLHNVPDVGTAERAAERFLHAFESPHQIAGHEVTSTASIGVCCSALGLDTAEGMMRDADTALYDAKASGRNRFRVFDIEMRARSQQRFDFERDLRRAIADEQLHLRYQPVHRLDSGVLVGFEALLRWNHPREGVVTPDRFISLAEETGLIVPIGEWVLDRACGDLAELQAAGCPDLTIAVNVSRRQLIQPDLPERVAQTLARTGIAPETLHLEITETTVMDQRHDMLSRLQQLRELGVWLSMDDFGTGFSSMSCLHDFPVQILKLDRSFIATMEQEREFTAIVQAIITLAQHLKLHVIAEGLETEGQVAQLQAMDCEYAQGYFFARPMVIEDVRAYLSKWNQAQSHAEAA